MSAPVGSIPRQDRRLSSEGTSLFRASTPYACCTHGKASEESSEINLKEACLEKGCVQEAGIQEASRKERDREQEQAPDEEARSEGGKQASEESRCEDNTSKGRKEVSCFQVG
jgi:hypothetical protein